MTANPKIDPVLDLSFHATATELSKSAELSFGSFFAYPGAPHDERIWEVIFTFTGDFLSLQAAHPSVAFTFLTGGYGIARGFKEDLLSLAKSDSVIYIEKPKRLFFEDYKARRASCISSAQSLLPETLTGRGVLVGIIDSGIDYTHPDFLNPDGTTRIALLFDQTLGEVYDSDAINLALSQKTAAERYALCPSIDLSGHGTFVAGVAAGNGRASAGALRGVAYEATLLVVKLGVFSQTGFPGTAQLMEAVDFCVTEAVRLHMPLALNLSFGNTYGSHSGTSVLETFFNRVSDRSRLSICVGSGNEGASGGHTGGMFPVTAPFARTASAAPPPAPPHTVEFAVSEYTPSLSIQLWKNYEDDFSVSVRNPAFDSSVTISKASGSARYVLGGTTLYVYYGAPAPHSVQQEIFMEFLPNDVYLDSGIWQLTFFPENIRSGEWELWMPASAVRSEATRFLHPTPEITLTIPSTASGVITVGAYDDATDAVAPFSGRGNTYVTNQPKPDLVAPGVDITSCAVGGGYELRSGTSMATPFVTGSCAALMQWGILDGNDPYLYGEKMKACLRRGARILPGTQKHPNPQSGWGALCLKNALPLL